MKSDWIWMPHAGHLCIGHKCRFHLNTYVNGYIVSTVGEYWPDAEVRRIFLKSRLDHLRLEIDEDGKLSRKIIMTEQECERIVELKGDYFDDAYLAFFGYEEIGLDRLYETMVFKAAAASKNLCCPWRTDTGHCIDMEGYNDPTEAFNGHMAVCEKWDKREHGSEYKEEE